MDLLESASVDLTVTSPPYDNLRKYAGLSFDKFKGVAEQLYRITKPGGVVVWVVGDATIKGSETGTSFRQALHFKDLGFNLHDTMIYSAEKPPLTHNRFEQKFEYMFVLSKGKPKTFNPLKVPAKYAGRKNSLRFRHDGETVQEAHTKGLVHAEKLRGNIWHYTVAGGTEDKIAHQHPAIFPIKLAEDHILAWSNAGDTVLDPFLGSGTTGKAACGLGRGFIGIEREDKYFELATRRIGGE